MNNAAASDMTVPNTILAKLGAGRFLAMTGATSLAGDANSLTFKLPARFAKNGINCVKIALDADDTYTMTFYKLGRAPSFSVAIIKETAGVYCDQLREIFTSATGLHTSL